MIKAGQAFLSRGSVLKLDHWHTEILELLYEEKRAD